MNYNQEIEKRIEILKECGLETDLDVMNLTLEGQYCISEPMMIGEVVGVIDSIKYNDFYKEIWDKATKNMTRLRMEGYFGILTRTSFGDVLSVLYISHSENEWEMQRQELRKGRVCVYCYNLREEQAEVGTIEFKMCQGGLVRTV